MKSMNKNEINQVVGAVFLYKCKGILEGKKLRHKHYDKCLSFARSYLNKKDYPWGSHPVCEDLLFNKIIDDSRYQDCLDNAYSYFVK